MFHLDLDLGHVIVEEDVRTPDQEVAQGRETGNHKSSSKSARKESFERSTVLLRSFSIQQLGLFPSNF